MPSLLNPKYEAFAQAFVRGETAGNRGRSYLAAGYTCDDKSAKENGSKLAKDPRVMRRIAELEQEKQAMEEAATERATARLAITREAVLAEMAKIAFTNMLDYLQPCADGGFEVDLARIDRDMGAAIREIVITSARGADEKPRVRIKLADKRAALFDLGRHFGLFVERRPGSHQGSHHGPHGPNANDDYADLSDEQLAAKIRATVAQMQRVGIDVAALFGIDEAALGGIPPARAH
jgi:phage terminase small subunit